jgi:CspA family cold shock protein
MAQSGVVKFYSPVKSFGFVRCDGDGKEIYCGAMPVVAAGLKRLIEGQRITFETESDPKGERVAQILQALPAPIGLTNFGTVKFFNPNRGFGFVADDRGHDVFLPDYCLIDAAIDAIPGTRLEYTTRMERTGDREAVHIIVGVVPPSAPSTREPEKRASAPAPRGPVRFGEFCEAA